MNKNFFSTKLGTVITLLLCLCAAVLFWLFVQYCDTLGFDNISELSSIIGDRL